MRERALRSAARSPLAVRVAVTAALEAWGMARLAAEPVHPERIGLVVCGNNLGGRLAQELAGRYGSKPQYLPPRFALQYQDTDHVGTLSEVLELRGEGFSIGAASASGNLGIIQASRAIEVGAVDACIVVGALSDLSALERQSFLNLGAMGGRSFASTPKAACRPFDRAREGFIYGQGAACLVLERRSSAERREARILAVLAGYAAKLDGNSQADPSEEGEARVMRMAMDRAGVRPEQVGYVNAHGTSSPCGDDTEVRAFHRAFGDAIEVPVVNSTKGWVGHCLSSAAIVEAVAVLVQMRDGFIHPNANLDQPIDPLVRFAGREAREMKIEHALSNAFGFGGFNSSVLFAQPA